MVSISLSTYNSIKVQFYFFKEMSFLSMNAKSASTILGI